MLVSEAKTGRNRVSSFVAPEPSWALDAVMVGALDLAAEQEYLLAHDYPLADSTSVMVDYDLRDAACPA